MSTLTLHSLPIYYNIIGSGTPIVMIHGWGPDQRIMSGCFEPIIATLPEGSYQRIYFDLPGMGQTPGADWINGSDGMLDIVIEFIDAVLPDQNFLLAGESYGGLLARGLVARRPEKVDGLLLICPVGETDSEKRDRPQLQVFEKDEPLLAGLSAEDRESFIGINVLQNQRLWERFAAEILPGLKLADFPLWDKTILPKYAFSFPTDSMDKPYSKPTLFLLGRQDNAVGYRDHWQFVEAYPHASFVVLDRAGHNLQIDQDVLFNALVKEWLERVRSGSLST
jgi:pimeloyl-ACP methyl ester carboxylesterase